VIAAIAELSRMVGRVEACRSLSVARGSFYRWIDPRPKPPALRPRPQRALSPGEREELLEVLHSQRFMDQAPREVYATLLDEGTYLGSVRTMYRVLDENGEVRERRDQLRRPVYKKPELLATGPNQVWSWDITKLLGPVKWTYFYLYVILDIFSRYVVGWMVAQRESAALAQKLIEETVQKEEIRPGQLTIHSDRGPSMSSKPVAFLLADLGITKTHSRPNLSNDNPYSEAQFKTTKYRPEFPERFGSIEDARSFCRNFFPWYNEEHHHTGIALLTPAMVHHGMAETVLRARQAVLSAAHRAHPERFVRRAPVPPPLPGAVWINPPKPEKEQKPENPGVGPENDPPGSPINDDLESTRPKPPRESSSFEDRKIVVVAERIPDIDVPGRCGSPRWGSPTAAPRGRCRPRSPRSAGRRPTAARTRRSTAGPTSRAAAFTCAWTTRTPSTASAAATRR